MSGDLRSGARQWAGRLPLAEAGELTGQQQALAAQLHAFAVPWAERAGFAGTRQEGHLIGPWNAQVHRPGPAAGFNQSSPEPSAASSKPCKSTPRHASTS